MAATAKSAVGEAPTKDKDKDEIVVNLRIQNATLVPERRLVLTPGRPAISIGRASKDHSKGFTAAADNAWLDNPVMSREHAQLFAKFDDSPAVYLKDVNSFHGTYLININRGDKQPRLIPDEPVELTHGDTIQFGIDIFRASKIYPPCLVNCLIEIQKPNGLAHRSFTVPDDVDDEDDEDCENEDDLTITAVNTRFSPIDLTGIGSPPVPSPVAPDNTANTKLSTGPTANGNISSNVIDLTAEAATCQPEAKPADTIDQGTAHPRGSDVSPLASAFPEGHPSPQERLRLNHTSDGRLVVITSPTPILGEPIYFHDDNVSDEDAESMLDQISDSDLDSSSEEEMTELSEADEPSRTYDDTSSEIEDDDEFSDDYAEDFDDSDAAWADPDDEDSVGGYSSGKEDEQDAITESSNAKPRTETPVVNGHETDPYDGGICLPHPMWAPLETIGIYNPSRDRDPSPSDAALVKRRPLLDTIPDDSRAQELGEKSGKFEFFAAREKNRAIVNQNGSIPSVRAILETLVDDGEMPFDTQPDGDDANLAATAVSNASRSVSPSLSCVPETVATAEGTEVSSEVPDMSSIKLADNDAHQYSAWSASGDRFINNPPNESSPICQTVPSHLPVELDMTSAYMFHQSKLATAAESVSKTGGFPVEDLLEREPKKCTIVSEAVSDPPTLEDSSVRFILTSTKRSYEEAFNQSEDDVMLKQADRVIVSNSPRITVAKDQGQTSCNDVDIATVQKCVAAPVPMVTKEQDTPKHDPTVILVQPEAPRAAKRMRLATAAAQVVACVALGSAATFSYLVNTAPVL
ncbi:hypothetical protein F4803DRAFT_508558 [Xylaria telfairii]|nr:hypothetical protein F4803DRAFT_508558 [Xylaria telfairii]